jgi:hypothetical protein
MQVGELAPIASNGPRLGARRTATPPREHRMQTPPDVCAWCTEAGWNIADAG